MPNEELKVPVKFIADRSPFKDGSYGTSFWEIGETRMVESATAEKLLRHIDTWAAGKAKDATKTSKENIVEDNKRAHELEEEEASQNLRDQVQAMPTKEAVHNFALVHYGQKIPMTKSLDNMRNDLIGMIDRFGPR
jgi:hypothetical protein